MKKISLLVLISLVLSSFASYKSLAQCSTSAAPSYPSGCTSDYFTSITAGGTGVVSTISYTGFSCSGTYFNYFPTEGVTAPTGSTVNINVSRFAEYLAYLAVYVDWNNDGIYETTELVGSVITLSTSTSSAVYSFTIPLIGIVTNTHLHMRVFLGEPPSMGGSLSTISPPCSAKWGESCDYYLDATCTTPTISISPASPSVCLPGDVTLTASGAGGTPTYIWSPVSGLSASTGVSVISSPTVTSTYTVTGYGPGVCLASTTVTVSVAPGPLPVLSPAGPVDICPGSGVIFSEISGTGSIYQWYSDGAAIAGATTDTYTALPSATTTYSVSLTNSSGCTGFASATVNVLPLPVAVITPVGPLTVCSPGSVLLNASFLPGYTYIWYNSAGVISGATSQSYEASSTDSYKVEITSAAGCVATSAPVSVTINPAPVASATASGPLTFCSYDSIVLTAAASAGYSYQWLDGTSIIAGATDISYTVGPVGSHDYRVKVTNGLGCSDTTASGLFPVVVNPAPVSALTASGPLTFCNGGSVTLNAPFVSGYSYQWYHGATVARATAVTGGTSSSLFVNAPGYYYVVVTTPAGCTTSSATSADLVATVTLPVISHNTPLKFCWGSSVTLLLGISSSTTGITYQWMRDTVGIPGANSSTYDAFTPGVYTCHIDVTGSCSGTTPPVTVAENPLPNPVISYGGGYLRTGSFYTQYQWYANFIEIPGATAYRMAPVHSAAYSVIVTDTNGCVAQSDYFTFDSVMLSTSTLTLQNQPVVYPNPAASKVFIDYAKNVDIIISGIDGKKLLENPAAKEIDIASLPDGIYLITLYDDHHNLLLTEKLVKQ